MLLSADILPQNTMYSNIRYDEPQRLGGLQPPSPPLSTPLMFRSVYFILTVTLLSFLYEKGCTKLAQ